jgi:TPR repeat protein
MKWLILAAVLLFNSASPGPSDADKAFRDFERGDYSLALKGWTLLANRGDAEDRYFLGHMYAEGLGAPQDYASAAFWFSESASQGYSHGQFALGYLYEHGWGVLKDHSNALKWYRLAADQSLAMAHNNVGLMYEEGRGVQQDYAEAHMRYSLAISLSNLNPGTAIQNLNNLIKKMTPAQTAQAKRLAREWRKEHLR